MAANSRISAGSMGRQMRLGLLVAGTAMLSVAGAQASGVPGKQYFTIGGGGGMQTYATPCPNIPCNGSDVCSCVTSSGTVKFSTIQQTLAQDGSYTLEVSGDLNTSMNNGAGGLCYFGTGIFTLTTVKGTLTIPSSGQICRIGTRPNTPYGMSAPAYIQSGTNKYSNAMGTGTFTGTFDPQSQTVLLDVVGYGILQGQ